jgi:hypothetical protein
MICPVLAMFAVYLPLFAGCLMLFMVDFYAV